jgi:hypothetical protein
MIASTFTKPQNAHQRSGLANPSSALPMARPHRVAMLSDHLDAVHHEETNTVENDVSDRLNIGDGTFATRFSHAVRWLPADTWQSDTISYHGAQAAVDRSWRSG